MTSLTPRILQREQEQSYKLLPPSQQEQGWCIRTNIMALLRGNPAARASYYTAMRNIGAYSVNDIRALEDLPGVEGGDEYAASLNYVPLKDWAALSVKRANGSGQAPADIADKPDEDTDPEMPDEKEDTNNGD